VVRFVYVHTTSADQVTDDVMQSGFDRTYFTQALFTALTDALRALYERIGNEQLYVFGLYTNGEGTYVVPTANTEEALERTARRHAAADRASLRRYRQILRWSPGDWAYHTVANESAFPVVAAYLETGWTADYATFTYDPELIYACCLTALQQFQGYGALPQHRADKPFLLNLFMGDQSDGVRLRWAKQLNSPACCTRFQDELAQASSARTTLQT
jgi:Domain of unknown function (DUF4303)